ncbi:MAG: 3-oxoacyl-[acyl-carrier-protein] synthase-3 [Halioglobus sp.]|jgi:3-oxoacyl-[acyl-carrier-protein] synthase-3
MALVQVNNVEISAIASCTPKNVKDNLDDPNIDAAHAKKVVDGTGIRYRRISEGNTTSDLCFAAAENIFEGKNIDKNDIEFLFFVSQTPDYPLPATSIILQDRLGLPQTTMALDINLGCSGYVYGLSVISTMLEKASHANAKALLLVGDVSSTKCNPKDLSTYPLFGDAGTATLLSKKKGAKMEFDLHSDGAGAGAIIIKDGGGRNPYSPSSEEEISDDGTNILRNKDLFLNGMDVFSFGITKVPRAIKKFYDEVNLDPETVDYYLFHQANLFMNEKIRKKLKISEEKVPYSLYEYGNVSSATIPITITSQLKNKIIKPSKIVSCGFGVGLSWGVGLFSLSQHTYLETLEI